MLLLWLKHHLGSMKKYILSVLEMLQVPEQDKPEWSGMKSVG